MFNSHRSQLPGLTNINDLIEQMLDGIKELPTRCWFVYADVGTHIIYPRDMALLRAWLCEHQIHFEDHNEKNSVAFLQFRCTKDQLIDRLNEAVEPTLSSSCVLF